MRRILVQADASPAAEQRIATALSLAERMDGDVVALIDTPMIRYIATDPFGGAYLAKEAFYAAREKDEGLAEGLQSRFSGKRLDVQMSEADPLIALADGARFADLVIVGLGGEPVARAHEAARLAGDLALEARVPVLALPEGANFDPTGAAVVAWNDSAESATAMRAALPLLKLASRVTILSIESEAEPIATASAIAYLKAHGVNAEVASQRVGARDDRDAALAQAVASSGAGMLVMGAYGRSRLREALFGGATRRLLDDAPLPLLLAH